MAQNLATDWTLLCMSKIITQTAKISKWNAVSVDPGCTGIIWCRFAPQWLNAVMQQTRQTANTATGLQSSPFPRSVSRHQPAPSSAQGWPWRGGCHSAGWQPARKTNKFTTDTGHKARRHQMHAIFDYFYIKYQKKAKAFVVIEWRLLINYYYYYYEFSKLTSVNLLGKRITRALL